MALRIAHYVTSLYMSLMKAGKQDEHPRQKLPVVFPVLLYNGDGELTAPTTLAELIEDIPHLGEYGIQCRYWKIAENEIQKETLLEIRNIVSTLFLAESYYDIDLLLDELTRIITTEEDRQAVTLFINWFRQLAVHGRIESTDFGKVEETFRSVEEARSMLITAIEKEKQEILQKGIEKGIEKGRVAFQSTIEQLLRTRFGNVSTEISAALTNCTLDQLQSLINPALDSPDLEAFLAKVPSQIGEEADIDAEADQDRH